MTKTLNQIFFFLHQNQNICFSNIGNQNIFLEKKLPLEVKWSVPKGIIFDENNHPSIDRIRKNAPKNNFNFDFKPTNTDTITKLVNKINIKKANGVDQISCKLLEAGSPVLNKHLTTLLNNTIKHSQFPNRLKEAHVVPLRKKNDTLDN
jgi:hypothetical protein